MSGGTVLAHIDAVDAFAKTLYCRLKGSPPSSTSSDDVPLSSLSVSVRHLHLALLHLRAEAADPDSLLNRSESSAPYARQLESLVEDCGFQLQQVDTALATIGIYAGSGETGNEARAERLEILKKKIANEKLSVDFFLDTIQLRNPAATAKAAGVVDGNEIGLENIKDKVDDVANRLFAKRRDGDPNSVGLADDEEGLWQEFKAELEKEGFSPQVLRRHKEVLRAYIRELETMSQQNGGLPPTVRGLLEHEAKTTLTTSSPKEMYPSFENEKFPTSMKDERRMPYAAPVVHMRSSFDRESRRSMSSEEGSIASDGGESMALISTRDLVAMDHLNASLAGTHLQAPGQQYGTSPNATMKYLPSSSAPTPGMLAELAGTPTNMALSASPRSMTTLPPYASPQLPPYSSPRTSMTTRLAPDAYGHEIPMEAQWTKVRRALLSLEVLDRAGVRYEARPEYVAILGRLTREEITEYARQSAECRAERSRGYGYQPKRYERPRADSKSSHEEDDNESVLWDESDTTDFDDDKTSDKGTKSYPYIVNFPEKDREKKTSPSSTVQPKSILKNKNENHVRFDPQPHEVNSKSLDRDRERDRDRRSSRRYRDDEDTRRSRRYHPEGGRNRRSVDDDRERQHYRGRGGGGGGRDREHPRYHSHRNREREEEEKRKEERRDKKKAWGETLGAGAIGGAAVSLLSVLAEAATGI